MSTGTNLTISRRAAEALRLHLVELDHHIEDIQARTRLPKMRKACAEALSAYSRAIDLISRVEAGEPDPAAPKGAPAKAEKPRDWLEALRRLDQGARRRVLRRLYARQWGLDGAALDAKLAPLVELMHTMFPAEGEHAQLGDHVVSLAAARDEALALCVGREVLEGQP